MLQASPTAAESTAPVAAAIPAHLVLPTGWVRTEDGRAVNLIGFVRDVVGHMATNHATRASDLQVQQMVAAAAFVQIARSLHAPTGRVVNGLVFPDEADLVDDIATH